MSIAASGLVSELVAGAPAQAARYAKTHGARAEDERERPGDPEVRVRAADFSLDLPAVLDVVSGLADAVRGARRAA